jgi:NADH:ubiquinone oxidoreductase subunit F (NADH-binding)/NADH:ubiquinone oxidoreductase subunit E
MTDRPAAMTDRAAILGGFPRERTWLLPALQALQRGERWLSPEALLAVAEHLRVPRSEVYGVATHYPELRLAEPGRRVVRVCTGVSCRIRGSLDLLRALETTLGLSADAPAAGAGARAAGGQVTLERSDCAFMCSMAPVVEVDGACAGRLGPGDLPRVLESDGAAWQPPAERAALPAMPAAGSPSERLSALVGSLPEPRGPALLVSTGSCGLAVGAGATLAALRQEVARRGLSMRVAAVGCDGLCWAAPAVALLSPDGVRTVVPGVTAGRVASLLDDLDSGRLAGDPAAAAYLAAQRRVLTERSGLVDPTDIAEAVRRGSYAALARALADGRPEDVIQAVKTAGLGGRGGAYFPAAVKWEGARRASGAPRYLIVNGEEGEPGIFKDRHLMEGDPHRLLEGALLAAYAAGADRIYLYVHGEAELAALRLARAIEDARAWGLVGPRVLGSDFSVEIEMRRGAGGFVLGEETALMESIEGRRAMPRAKPPFPTEAGLWGRPTVINNVETLFAVPLIVARGGDWWASLGGGHGTKCFGLSGHLARPGMVEMEMGASLRTLCDALGGGTGGRPLAAAVVGGPSGIVAAARLFDEPMVPGGAVNPGTGGVVALDDTVSVRDVVRTLLDFNARESCGKCTPCREGAGRLAAMLDAPGPPDRAAIEELSEVVRMASLCGLGQAAPLSLLSGLREFAAQFGDRGAG